MWSLLNAPAGVTINQKGLITVAADAQLAKVNEITVQAVYLGKEYARPFRLTKALDGVPGERGEGAPKYLGKTMMPSSTNTVYIKHTDTYSANVSADTGDYIAYVGASDPGSSVWKKNYCLRWNGSQWEQLDPLVSANTDYYMRAFNDIMNDNTETGAFSVVFAKKIMAMEATIDELQTKLIQVKKGIFGGSRFTKNSFGNVVDNGSSLTGFHLSQDGKLKASDVEISGHIFAESGTFSGTVNATDGNFSGLINSTGFLSSKYLGSAVDRAGWEIFEYFEFIPIGKKLNINGGGVLLNNTPNGGTNNYHNCIALWIDRITVDMIEIRGYPITIPNDRWVLCQCKRNDNTIVSHRYLFTW